jgi:hypothetical protein
MEMVGAAEDARPARWRCPICLQNYMSAAVEAPTPAPRQLADGERRQPRIGEGAVESRSNLEAQRRVGIVDAGLVVLTALVAVAILRLAFAAP